MLRLINLRKTFGGLTAVDDLSLRVERGEVFGLLGPNGAGKSTTLSMCLGLIAPDSGRVELEGIGSPTEGHVRGHLGLAPQSLAIYDGLTGEENLAFFGRLYGLRGAELRRRIGAMLELVGLAPRAADRAGTYSGGMKRRLNLAAAMMHEPPLLLLDEPTAGVDPQSRNNILDTVRSLAERGHTVIYTTHYMEEAQRLCDRVGIIDKGRLLCVGGVREVVQEHGGRTVVHIERGDSASRVETDEPLREIERALAPAPDAGGVAVTGVRIDRPDLESVFLNLTGRRLRD